MQEEKGYSGFTIVELNEAEKSIEDVLQMAFKHAVVDAGFTEETASRLTLEFAKATLNISDEEARSGAWHSLADGKPFYRIELTLKDSSMNSLASPDEAALLFFHLAVNMPPFRGKSALSMGSPLYVNTDVRTDDILGKVKEVVGSVRALGEMKRAQTGAYAPKPN